MSFLAKSWPPGRACSPGTYSWEHFPLRLNHHGQLSPAWIDDFHSCLNTAGLSRTNSRRIKATLLTALKRAERGALTVAVDGYWKGTKSGDVDAMARSNGKILEIRLEEVEGATLLKGKKLRFYFAEPLSPEILLGLVFAPKDAHGKLWKSQQNLAVDRAAQLADEWANSSGF